VAFARAVIARGIIRDRTAVGWSQAQLARRAGVHVETLNRIERAKGTPDTAMSARIDRHAKRARDILE
jgi:transcriptional regulator with XRE-family HTH domain